jgi:nitrate/nitrite-specific signal transduction histidine kinase
VFGTVRRKARFSPALAAFVVIALVALLQLVFVLRLAGSQLAGAQVIDQSGAQRMRSQILAYNAAMAHFGEPDPNWRENVERSIAEMNAVRVLLRHSSRSRSCDRCVR